MSTPASVTKSDTVISSPAGSLASRIPALANGKARTTIDTSGLNSLALSIYSDHFSFSLRTFLSSEIQSRTKCSVIWSNAGTPRGRPWWVLRTSALPTDETESGLSEWTSWPSPTVQGNFRKKDLTGRSRDGLVTAVRKHGNGPPLQAAHSTHGNSHAFSHQWKTPKASDVDKRGQMRGDGYQLVYLTRQAQQWATPRAERVNADSHGQAPPEVKNKGSLNAAWVLQLMGLPPSWCSISDALLVGMMLARGRGGRRTKSKSHAAGTAKR
jgi:hypothetical protein